MGSNHFTSAVLLRDLPMEIHFAFYPPPTVMIPEIRIPELTKYEYKFDRERTAIRKYDEEQRRLRLQAKQQKNKLERTEELQTEQQHELEITEKVSAQNNELSSDEFRPIDPSNKKQIEDEYLNFATGKIARIDLMDQSSAEQTSSESQGQNTKEKQNTFPHPFPANSTNSDASSNSNGIAKKFDKFEAPILSSTSNPWPSQPSHFAPQSQQKQKYTLNGLEEFERKRDLFDLLELRSLDDRRELEKLLLNGTGNWDAGGGNSTTGIGGGNH